MQIVGPFQYIRQQEKIFHYRSDDLPRIQVPHYRRLFAKQKMMVNSPGSFVHPTTDGNSDHPYVTNATGFLNLQKLYQSNNADAASGSVGVEHIFRRLDRVCSTQMKIHQYKVFLKTLSIPRRSGSSRRNDGSKLIF